MGLAILCSGQAGQHPRMLDDVLAAPDCAGLRAAASDVLGQEATGHGEFLSAEDLSLAVDRMVGVALEAGTGLAVDSAS